MERQRISLLLLLLTFYCTANQKFVPKDPLAARIETPGAQSTTLEPSMDMVAVQSAARTFHIDRYETSEIGSGDFFSARNQNPRVQVTAAEAGRICAGQGKRLCSYYEWKNACLGIRRNQYSYGKTHRAEACNLGSKGLLPTGKKRECHTDTEVHDMLGNAMEWVADMRRGRAVAVGGSFATGNDSDCFTVHYFSPDTRNNQIGFRCCL